MRAARKKPWHGIWPNRRPGAWAGGLLLFVAPAVIAANALLLQDARHPGALIATRAMPDMPERTGATGVALPTPRPYLEARGGSASAAGEDPLVFAVQQALNRAGYGPVPPDGLLGPRTEQAVRRFQLDEGLAVNGRIDDALVRRLIALGAMEGS